MSTPATADLPPLPTLDVLNQMHGLLAILASDPNNRNPIVLDTTVKLLQAYPGLARTDAGWYAAFPNEEPTICIASRTSTSSLIVLECLKLGSSPMAKGLDGTPALLDLVEHNHPREYYREALDLALAHPDTARLDALNEKGQMILQLTDRLMNKGNADDFMPHARRIFKTLTERVPRELLREKMSLEPFFKATFVGPTQEDVIFIARLLADCGVDLDKITAFPTGAHHPLELMADVMEEGKKTRMGALLAAGLSEHRLCTRDYKGVDCSIGQYLDGKSHFSKSHGAKIRAKARAILEKEMKRFTSGGEGIRDVLISPYGCASWQAQGLLNQGMLMPLFDAGNAALFGGREEQLKFAVELAERFPPHQHFNIQGLLRDAPLSRPDDSATVLYLRGASLKEALSA